MLRQMMLSSLTFIALISRVYAGFEHLIDTEALIAHLETIGQGKEDGIQHEEPLLIDGKANTIYGFVD